MGHDTEENGELSRARKNEKKKRKNTGTSRPGEQIARWTRRVGAEHVEQETEERRRIKAESRHNIGTQEHPVAAGTGSSIYTCGALHNLAACTSHKLEVRLKRGDYNFISTGYISGLKPDEMFKIVVQPIAFKEEHTPLGTRPVDSVPLLSIIPSFSLRIAFRILRHVLRLRLILYLIYALQLVEINDQKPIRGFYIIFITRTKYRFVLFSFLES